MTTSRYWSYSLHGVEAIPGADASCSPPTSYHITSHPTGHIRDEYLRSSALNSLFASLPRTRQASIDPRCQRRPRRIAPHRTALCPSASTYTSTSPSRRDAVRLLTGESIDMTLDRWIVQSNPIHQCLTYPFLALCCLALWLREHNRRQIQRERAGPAPCQVDGGWAEQLGCVLGDDNRMQYFRC